MNFLGHLYFSNNIPELMYANLFGDFVKGTDLSQYPEYIQKGIRLHRKIDSYIDNHPSVIQLRHKLYASLPKVAGIAIDLYFDHILAKRWSDFHRVPLQEFIATFHNYKIKDEHYHSDQFRYVLSKMKQEQWLIHYTTLDGLGKACKGLSNRISFPNVLAQAPEVYLQNEKIIEVAFEAYMVDAIPHFNAYLAEESL